MEYMFDGCRLFTGHLLAHWDTKQVPRMGKRGIINRTLAKTTFDPLSAERVVCPVCTFEQPAAPTCEMCSSALSSSVSVAPSPGSQQQLAAEERPPANDAESRYSAAVESKEPPPEDIVPSSAQCTHAPTPNPDLVACPVCTFEQPRAATCGMCDSALP